MEQVSHLEPVMNLSERVKEDYSELTWENVRPIISRMWEWWKEKFRLNTQDIIDRYIKTECKVRDIAKFDYIPSDVDYSGYAVKFKENVANIRIKVGRKEKWVPCDQCLKETDYSSLANKKVLNVLLMEKFPFLNEDMFYEVEETEVDLSKKKVKDLIKQIGDMTIEELRNSESFGVIKLKERKQKFEIYFDEKGKHCLFIHTGKISTYIDIESLLNRNFEEIIKEDKKVNGLFTNELTQEEQGKRNGSPLLRRIKEYCEE